MRRDPMPENDAAEPFPTSHEWASAVSSMRDRLMGQRQRASPPGTWRACPVCKKKGLESRDDLLRESVAGAVVLVHHNLHGARCRNCQAEFLEAYEEVALEEAAPDRRLTDYLAKVTSVSGRNLGTYWPRDVVRVMDLHKEDSLRVQVLDEDT